jgi:hypothetical protein
MVHTKGSTLTGEGGLKKKVKEVNMVDATFILE